MKIVKFNVHDKLMLKKNHPCGNCIFTVLRIGSDIRLVCDGCGRDLTLERTSLEKNIKKVLSSEGA